MLARYVLPLGLLLDACCQPGNRSYSQQYFSLEPVCEPCVERVCLRPTRATITSYYVRALSVVTPFHAFHSSAFSLVLSAYLQESNTYGVGLFAVMLRKAGVAHVDRRLLRYYLIVRRLPNVFALACRS